MSVIAYHAAYFVAIASHRWFDSAPFLHADFSRRRWRALPELHSA